MSNIRLQTRAIKVVNKGGGVKSGSEWRESTTDDFEPDEINRIKAKSMDPNSPNKMILYKKFRVEKRSTGSDYIVFQCPACNSRNKRCSYDGKVEDKGKELVYKCNRCYRDVEVSRPIDLMAGSELVHVPGGILGADGKAIG